MILPSYRIGKFTYDRVGDVEKKVDKLWVNLRNELRLLDRKYEMLYWFLINNGNLYDSEQKKKLFKCFECPSEGLRERQLALAGMLKEFKSLCEENGLTYWLEGGTLLGAIRHDGFIPWDDDVDINMPAEDMEKLKEIIDNGNEKFTFRNKYNYYLGCIVPGVVLKDDDEFWIDIFPMELTDCSSLGLEETEKEINRYSKEMRKILRSNLLKPVEQKDEFIDMEDKGDEKVHYIKSVMDEYCNMIPRGAEPNCCFRSLTAHNSPGGGNLFFLKDVFPLTQAEFEGEIYPVPLNYDLWLSTYYGDYYHVPLNRVPKH